MLLVALMLVVPWKATSDLLLNNVVWLAALHRAVEPEQPSTFEAAASRIYQRQGDDVLPRIRLGLGILAAFDGDEQAALDLWRDSSDRSRLVSVGRDLERRGRTDLALLHYRGAGETRYTMGWFAAGRLCQRRLATLFTLAPSGQAVCGALFEGNQDNLILNGQFETQTLDGWSDHMQAARLSMDPSAPGAWIQGRPGARGQGPYQFVALPAGTRVRFAADIRIVEAAPSDLRILYVSRTTPEGKAAGNALGLDRVPPAGSVTHVEREMVLPPAQDNLYRFCPLLLDGAGAAVIDNVSLQIITP